MSVFDQVATINSLLVHGGRAQEEGESLIAWGKAAIELSARLRREAEADATKLEGAAKEAASFLATDPVEMVAASSGEEPNHKPARKTRSDAGKPRGSSPKTNEHPRAVRHEQSTVTKSAQEDGVPAE